MFLIKICQYENLNSMPSEARKIFFEKFSIIECKKVQFGPQNIIWGLKNE